MAIDLTQFYQTFFEESLEGLSDMESELLRIDTHTTGRRNSDLFEADQDSLNIIFRAVHSMKGGSSTFGFNVIANFSHVLENLLDDLREGRCEKTRELISVLLQSCDCLRILIENAKNGDKSTPKEVTLVQKKLETLFEGGSNLSLVDDFEPEAETPEHVTGWNILFKPNSDIIKTGNDPLRLIRVLAQLGKLDAKINTGNLPGWKKLDPEMIYLSWELVLNQAAKRQDIDNIFSWVIDDCELDITAQTEERGEREESSEEIGAETDESVSFVPTSGSAVQSIRVSTPKIDEMVDLVGELVITQTMLSRFSKDYTEENISKLQAGLSLLERNTRELQESVLSVRMLPVGFAFNKLPRIVRDVSQRLDKKVKLEISGEGTELDKSVIEGIGDALMHIVRNSVDHAVESPKERKAAGKPETATIYINASQQGGNVEIVIEDDGRGLQRDVILNKAVDRGLVKENAGLTPAQIDDLIFLPGFTTAKEVTGVSGRGVGLDVVRTRLADLGGHVEVSSKLGSGTKFSLRLPLTLAIMDGLCIRVGSQVYIIPLLSVVESISISEDKISHPAGGSELVPFRDEYLPFLRMYHLFNIQDSIQNIDDGIVIIIEADNRQIGLFVDEIVGQQQVVVKSLEAHYKKVEGISTATILGDGEVALILDISTLASLVKLRGQNSRPKLKAAS